MEWEIASQEILFSQFQFFTRERTLTLKGMIRHKYGGLMYGTGLLVIKSREGESGGMGMQRNGNNTY